MPRCPRPPTSDRWTAVDRYFADRLLAPDAALDAALEASAAAGLPPISVSPTQGKLLQLLARIQGARTILEIGTLGGYSTIWLARALPPAAGWSRSSSTRSTPRSRARTSRAPGLADVVEVRVGRALDTLPQLAAEGPARSTSSSSTPTSRATPTTSTGRSSCRGPAA